jgi:hypothetical protein
VAIARDNGKIAIWDLDTGGHILAKLGLSPERGLSSPQQFSNTPALPK